MTRNTLLLGTLFLAAMPAVSSAAPITLRRDMVIPVIFDDSLSMRNSREGDHFAARVDDSRYLPSGTRFEGRVVAVRQGKGNEPGMMDLEFTEIVMPDGQRQRIDAFPVPLSDKYVSRDRDGRFTAKRETRRKEGYVLGGMVGGFILGSIFQKQLEGTVIGAIAGVIMATSDKGGDGNTVVNRGDRMGAAVNRDVTFDYKGDWRNDDRRDDRRDQDRRDDDWRRDDRRDQDRRNDDRWNRDDRRDDDRRGDDRWQGQDRDVKVTYGLREVKFADRAPLFREQGVIMVPLEAAASQMGMRVSREEDPAGRYIFIDGKEGLLKVEIGSREAKLNGRSVTLPMQVFERDRTLYIPLETLAQIARETVYVNGTRVARRSL